MRDSSVRTSILPSAPVSQLCVSPLTSPLGCDFLMVLSGVESLRFFLFYPTDGSTELPKLSSIRFLECDSLEENMELSHLVHECYKLTNWLYSNGHAEELITNFKHL